MFDPFTLALIGGGIGALTNKKDPLKGGLLGAGLGAAGGYGAGLLSPAAPGAGGMSVPASPLLGTGGMSVAPAALPTAAPTTIKSLTETAKPWMMAAHMGKQAADMVTPQQQPIQASPITAGGANNSLGQMLNNIQQEQSQQMQTEQQKRAARRQQWGNV